MTFLRCLLPVFLVGCTAAAETVTEEAERLRPVRFATVAPAAAAPAPAFPGRVRADRRPALSFRVPGRVVAMTVDVGDNVAAGAVVARLDARDYRSRLAQAEATVQQARADAQRSAREAGRAARLFAERAASEADRDRTRDLAAAAAARLASAKQARALAARALEYTTLRAPASGTVVQRTADVGVNVDAGQPVLQIAGAQLEVRFDVPESALSEVRVGVEAQVRLPALGEVARAAEVVRVGRATVDGGVLFPVFLELRDVDPAVVPGLAAEVRLASRARPGDGPAEVAVPPSAVVADPDGAFVWTLEPLDGADPERFVSRRRPVVVHRLTGRTAVLSSGLAAGERVATAGASYLFEGRHVRAARLPPLTEPGAVSEGSVAAEVIR